MVTSPQYRRKTIEPREGRPAYAIICTSRGGARLGIKYLVRVDKRIHPEEHWWTSDKADKAMAFRSLNAATRIAETYEHNEATVVPYQEAVDILKGQAESIAVAKAEEQEKS